MKNNLAIFILVCGTFLSCFAQQDIYGLIDESVVLECDVAPQWKKGSIDIPAENTTKYSFFGNILEINKLQEDDFGIYSCSAEKTFQLLKGELPTLSEGFESTKKLEGDSIAFRCKVEGTPNVDPIIWKFNNKSIPADSNIKISSSKDIDGVTTSELTIQSLTLQNNGLYSCSGETILGAVGDEAYLDVYSKRTIFTITPKRKYSVLIGSDLIAVCEVYGNLVQSLLWKLNDVIIKGNSSKIQQSLQKNAAKFLLRNTLLIKNIDDKDEGKLECEVSDAFTVETREAFINVFEYPKALRISAVKITETEIFLKLNRSSLKDLKGMSFHIIYGISNSGHLNEHLESTSDNIILKDLLPYTNYSMCSYSANPAGQSPVKCKMFQTKEMSPPSVFEPSVLKIQSQSITLLFTRKINLSENSTLERNIILSFAERGKSVSKNITLNSTSEKTFEYEFTGLKPYTAYTFYVNERMEMFDGKIMNITANTTEAAPSKPQNLREVTKGSTSVTLTWDKPLQLNGLIREFKTEVYFFAEGDQQNSSVMTADVSKREMTITNLHPFVQYTMYVYERTTEYSPYAEVRVKTLASVPQAAPSGLAVVDKNQNSARIAWHPIPAYLYGGEQFKYLITYESEGNQTKFSQDPSTTSVTLKDLRPYTEYKLSVAGTNKEGTGDEVEIKFSTLEGVPSQPRNVTGKAIISSIRLTWLEPLNMNGRPNLYQVTYEKLLACSFTRCTREMPFSVFYYDNGTLPLNGAVRSHIINRVLDPYSMYSITIRESTKTGGWGEYSKAVQVITEFGVPSKPRNVTAVSMSDTSITITWEEPQLPNGLITSYRILTYFGSALLKNENYQLSSANRLSNLRYTITGLESESTYVVQIKGFNTYLGDPSDRLYVKTAAPAPSFPWLFVVLGCLATLFLIACMVAVFIFVTRRNSRSTYKNVKTKEEVVMNNTPQSKPILVAELKQYCHDHHANSDFLYHEEFESIVVPTTNYTFEHSRMPYNQSKNRYSNILPYDHSRVTLNPIDNEVGSSYINANFIDGYKHNKKYIATQGPLPETVLDFWRMIWEQNVPIIVMLTKLVEDNRLKCEQYWPPGEGLQYKDIVVKVLSISELTDYTVRIFQVYKFNNPSAGQRIVRQYHYTAWPDHGVPSHPTSMLSFVRHVMTYHEVGRLSIENAKKLEGSIVVHCSAGVGRTGTFIAIEGCLKQIEEEQKVDVYGSVYRMRKQRNYMVQTEHQYTFIYDALLDSVICGNTEIAPADLVAKIRYLNERDPDTGETNFAAEFKRLECGILQKDVKQFGDANHLENKQKNRFLNILPFDKNRVRLTPIAGIRHSDYINASVIDGFQQKNTFIAAQAPLENTVNDFWRMIVEKNIHIVVMLTRLEEKGQDKCYLYWPQASTVSYGKVLVGFIDSKEEDSFVIHHLRVTNKETQRSWTVIHFNYLGWPEYGSPDNGTEIIHLIGRVQNAQRSIKGESGPILVHCSGGVGRTGVFVSVFNSIERLKAKDVVDIFQTTRALRLQRTAMVQTIDQYIFCYQALKDYLDSFDLYANPKC